MDAMQHSEHNHNSYGSELDKKTYHMLSEMKEDIEEKEKRKMGVSTNDVGVLAGLTGIGGYGLFGGNRGDGLADAVIVGQNSRNLNAIKDGTTAVIDNNQQQTLLGTLLSGNQTADIKASIIAQSAGIETRFNTIARELCDLKAGQKDQTIEMYKLDKANKDVEINKLNTIAALKEGCVNSTCNTCCSGGSGGADITQLTQIVIGLGNQVAGLAAAMGK